MAWAEDFAGVGATEASTRLSVDLAAQRRDCWVVPGLQFQEGTAGLSSGL